jgi:hypothetical protein
VLVLAAGAPAVLVAACGAAALAARLAWARGRRLEEYDADLHSVALLDRTGVPGLAAVTATLNAAAHRDGRWYRTVGWLTGSHPTAAARIRAVQRGRRVPRLDWSWTLHCTVTGHRLLSAGHRHEHRTCGYRCRLTWWRLLPRWGSPAS